MYELLSRLPANLRMNYERSWQERAQPANPADVSAKGVQDNIAPQVLLKIKEALHAHD